MSGAEAGIACVIVTQLLQGRICSHKAAPFVAWAITANLLLYKALQIFMNLVDNLCIESAVCSFFFNVIFFCFVYNIWLFDFSFLLLFVKCVFTGTTQKVTIMYTVVWEANTVKQEI